MTNLKWQVNGAQVQQSFNIPKVSVLNDFAAVGHGITGLGSSELVKLNNIEPVYDAVLQSHKEVHDNLTDNTGP